MNTCRIITCQTSCLGRWPYTLTRITSIPWKIFLRELCSKCSLKLIETLLWYYAMYSLGSWRHTTRIYYHNITFVRTSASGSNSYLSAVNHTQTHQKHTLSLFSSLTLSLSSSLTLSLSLSLLQSHITCTLTNHTHTHTYTPTHHTNTPWTEVTWCCTSDMKGHFASGSSLIIIC